MKNLSKRAFFLFRMPVKKIGVLYTRFKSPLKWRALRKNDRILLELGSGSKKGSNGWTTVDLIGADIACDLKNGISLPDNSVDKIYTSHTLEHIPYQDLIIFINECYRVLKKGGELSVCVPDARLYVKAYMERRYFISASECYQPGLVDTGSFIDQLNYIAYMGQSHKYMFDCQNLVNTLRMAPFEEVTLRNFDEALDLRSRHFESIYALAIK